MLAPLLASLGLRAAPRASRTLHQRRVARDRVITGEHGLVDERYVRLGGVDQWVSVRGERRDNPVLLVLHGGPGAPYTIFTPLLRAWEQHFTIVQWDRRGAGRTLGRNGKRGCGELSFARDVDDAIELAEHLHRRLGPARLIALGSSMGNLVAAPLVKRRPDLFAAYVATDLGVSARGEAVTLARTLARLRAAGRHRAAAALAAMDPDPARWTLAEWNRKQRWTMKLDPHMQHVARHLLTPLIFGAPHRSLRDVYDLIVGLDLAAAAHFAEFMATDLRALGPRYELPFFLFQGDDDAFTPTELAAEYFAEVDAPLKHYAEIHDAGHFAAFARPQQFLRELLTHVRPAVA